MKALFVAVGVCVATMAVGEFGHASGKRSVLANGGVRSSNSFNAIHGTLGQSALGTVAGSGRMVCSGYWCFGASKVLDAGKGRIPDRLALESLSPNPSRGELHLALAMPRAGQARITVVDVSGRSVSDPMVSPLEAGVHRIAVAAAKPLDPGVYFARIEVDGKVLGKRRFTIVR